MPKDPGCALTPDNPGLSYSEPQISLTAWIHGAGAGWRLVSQRGEKLEAEPHASLTLPASQGS